LFLLLWWHKCFIPFRHTIGEAVEHFSNHNQSTMKPLLFFLCIGSSVVMHAQTIVWSQDCNNLPRPTDAVAYSADGSQVMSGSECDKARIRLYTAASGTIVWDYLEDSTLECILGVKLSSNGVYFGAIEEHGNLLIWNNSSGTPTLQNQINVGSGGSYSLDFSPDNAHVVVDGDDDSLRMYSTVNGSLERTFGSHHSAIVSVDYSDDGAWIVSGSLDSTVKVWNAATGALVHAFSPLDDGVVGVKFAHDASHLAAVTASGTVKVWMTGMWMEHNSFSIGEAGHSIDVSDDATYVVVGGETQIHVHKTMGATAYTPFNVTDGGAVNGVDFQPGGTNVLAGTSNGKVTVWSLATLLGIEDLEANVTNVRVYPNPVVDQLVVSGLSEHAATHYTIYSLDGTTVRSGLLKSVSSTMDVTALPVGEYILTLRSASGTSRSYRWVKNER
jgi:WD40 repeat protein